MPWFPLAASCALVCSAVMMDLSGPLALRAAAGRLVAWLWLLLYVVGTGSSICMNSKVVVMEIVYNALSCEAGGVMSGMRGSFPEFLMAFKMPWQMAVVMVVMVMLYMEKTGLVYPAISLSLFLLATASKMSWRLRMRVGSFWHRLMRVIMCSSSLRRLQR